jgi:hypothetical protein
MSMKNINENTGNRTSDLPARNPVPQTTALPRAAYFEPLMYKIRCQIFKFFGRRINRIFMWGYRGYQYSMAKRKKYRNILLTSDTKYTNLFNIDGMGILLLTIPHSSTPSLILC